MKHICSPTTKSVLYNVIDGDAGPNACDIRLSRVFGFVQDSVCILSETVKQHRETYEIYPNEDLFWTLQPGTYEILMDNMVVIEDKESGFVMVRSTLNRNGVFITSGLYDSGYGIDVASGEYTKGTMAGALHVTGGPLMIQKGTRVGQFILFDAETRELYDGSYGSHKEHDQMKYVTSNV